MDPITTAIVGGIMSGLAAGATSTVTTAIKDAYNVFKGMLAGSFGPDSLLLESISALERNPESTESQAKVADEVAKIKADQEEAILSQAKKLLALIDESNAQGDTIINTGSGAIATGSGPAAGKGGIAVGGDVHGGISTGKE